MNKLPNLYWLDYGTKMYYRDGVEVTRHEYLSLWEQYRGNAKYVEHESKEVIKVRKRTWE